MAKEKGVILIEEQDYFYTAEDVKKILKVGKTTASNIIKSLRNELIKQGVLVENFPVGKVPKKYFNKRCGIDLSEIGL